MLELNLRVVVGADPDEHADRRLAETIGRQSRVFKRLPRNLEQQALLRIDASGFARRNAKEAGVESGDVFEKTAPARAHLAGRVGIGIVVGVDIPALARNFTHATLAGLEQ